MYLRYDNVTGEVLRVYSIPVPKPYIEITEEEANKVTTSPKKYFVRNGVLTTRKPQAYLNKQRIEEINTALNQADTDYTNKLNTPVQYTNGNYYKPKWIDDGTYAKLITGVQAGVFTFPQTIWDATELAENAVEMSQEEFLELCLFLTKEQQRYFNERKETKSLLLQERKELGE